MNAHRQKPKQAQSASRIALDYDEALDFVRHIETLAGLLEASGQNKYLPVDAVLVGETGLMIRQETAQLRGVLQTIVHRACGK